MATTTIAEEVFYTADIKAAEITRLAQLANTKVDHTELKDLAKQ